MISHQGSNTSAHIFALNVPRSWYFLRIDWTRRAGCLSRALSLSRRSILFAANAVSTHPFLRGCRRGSARVECLWSLGLKPPRTICQRIAVHQHKPLIRDFGHFLQRKRVDLLSISVFPRTCRRRILCESDRFQRNCHLQTEALYSCTWQPSEGQSQTGPCPPRRKHFHTAEEGCQAAASFLGGGDYLQLVWYSWWLSVFDLALTSTCVLS